MRNLLFKVISKLNRFFLGCKNNRFWDFSGEFVFARISASTNNTITFIQTNIVKSTLTVLGDKNVVHCNNSLISNSNIRISGNNNELRLFEGVKLRNSNIIIRGNNCKVLINSNTTFGGIRIINTGEDNSIVIGKDCLFSDNIELWASDTHNIYDEDGKRVNPEKPIKIGDNVWVGSRVIILKGVDIGNGSILGMGSVITKDVPENVISIGHPNRTLREKVRWEL